MEYHIIDVFTDKLFGGNSAGVCFLDAWLPDNILQSIAAENNLPETAFLVKQDGYYDLRWFSPSIEIDLCGHATMASAFVLFEEEKRDAEEIKFKTMSGILTVSKKGDILELDFPARPVAPCPIYQSFEKAFGIKPAAVYKAVDFLVLVENEEILRNIEPDFAALRQIKSEAELKNDSFGVIVTAAGGDCDFVSRFFAPNAGIDEDPVTGRAHCSLIPFWSEKLGKTILTAKQLSKRGGALFCEDCGERVKIGGKAVRYLRGEIEIEHIYNNPVTIRHAVPADAPDMAEVHMRSWEVAYKDFVPSEYIKEKNATRPELWQRILSEMKRPQYVIQKNGMTVGIMCVAPPQDDDLSEDCYELHGIYLHPDCYRQKIGTQAMEFAFGIARNLGKKTMTVWVFAENANSIKFYEKCGFEADGKTKTLDCGKPLTAIRMRKDL